MKSQGFTLLEIIMVILFVAIIGLVGSELFIGQNRVYKIETAELNINANARLALDDIDNYVRLANRTLDSYSIYTAGSQILILKIQSVNASDQLLPAVYDYVVFYLSSSDLYREVFPDAASSRTAVTKRLASNVNSLNFSYNNVDYSLVKEVTTDLTLQEDAGIQNRAITISTKSILRNY